MVSDSRKSEEGQAIPFVRRRRECLECRFRFTTWETDREPADLIEAREKHQDPRSKLLNAFEELIDQMINTKSAPDQD